MTTPLTSGALLKICQGGNVDNPVLQVLGVKKIAGSACDRFRILISDGLYSNSFAMLATQLNPMVHNNELAEFSIVRSTRHLCNSMQGKKVIIFMELQLLHKGYQVRERIGNPLVIEGDGSVTPEDVQSVKRPAETTSTSEPPLKKPVQSSYAGSSFSPTQIRMTLRSECAYVVIPISALNPIQNGWTIKGRVVRKSDIRPWGQEQGRLFSVDLTDDTGEIRATAFNDLCDRFYNKFDIGKVYAVKTGLVKASDSRYTGLNNRYEMTLLRSTEVLPYSLDTSDIPAIHYEFCKIANISPTLKDQTVDVLGICKSWSEVTTFTAQKTKREMKKRVVNIVDQSLAEVGLTLWGTSAETFDPAEDHPVIAVKGAKVTDYGGVSLTAWSSSVVEINPDIAETDVLKDWYAQEGGSGSNWVSLTQSSSRGTGDFNSGTNMKTVAEVMIERLGTNSSGRQDYYSMMATVGFIRQENLLYKGCVNVTDGEKACNKKLIDMNNGLYRCERCGTEGDRFSWRLIVRCNLVDATGNFWATCFQDEGEQLLGLSAEELGEMMEADKQEFLEHIENRLYKRYNFRLRCKTETYNGRSNVKHIIVEVSEIQYSELARRIILELDKSGFKMPEESGRD